MKITPGFIRGLVVGEGTFTFTTTGNKLFKETKRVPAFQLRMHVRDKELVVAVRDTLRLDGKIYEYIHNRRHYAMLIVRNIGDIKNVIIPFFYNKLKGYKRTQFDQWLEDFNKPEVADCYKFIYKLYKNGYYDKIETG